MLNIFVINSDNNRKFEISFPSIEESSFVENFSIENTFTGKSIHIGADMFTDAQDKLQEIAAFFTGKNAQTHSPEEVSLMIAQGCFVHLCVLGNHVRFTVDDEETGYWVCDEFYDAPSEVWGAVLGLLTQTYRQYN